MKNQSMKWVKTILILAASITLAAALALVWGFMIEPSLLTVTAFEFTDNRLPKAMDGARVMFFSDLHVGSCYSEGDAERAAKKIAELKPDLLLFGGDLTQKESPDHLPNAGRVARAFAAIPAKYGKFAVYGNHDIWPAEVEPLAREILKGGGFTILENRSVAIADGFAVAGTLPWPLHTDGGTAVGMAAEKDTFTILVAHEPAQAGQWSKYPFALQLSGHTHGGQVALPFIGPLARTYATEGYYAGKYQVNGMTLYVSRGVGVIDRRVRFCAPPEIVVVTLHRQS